MEERIGSVEEKKTMNPNFWRGRRVFVTGATGILGSWLVKDLLAAGADVIAFIRDLDPASELYRSHDIERITVVNGRLEDFWAIEAAINKYEIETVFHLGAQAIVGVAQRNPLNTFESNIRGTYNLLEACRIHKESVKQIVVASSDKAYGQQPKLPYTEDMPLKGQYPYEVSKTCADLISQSYYHAYGLPVAVIRCGNIYGGADLNWSRIVPGTIRSLLHNQRPIIRSNGKYVRDYIYVKDVARMYMHTAQSLQDKKIWGEAFNFSACRPLSVIEIVKTISELMDAKHLKPKILNHAEGEIISQYLSCLKTAKIIKYKPQFSLKQGMLETIEWYREYFKITE